MTDVQVTQEDSVRRRRDTPASDVYDAGHRVGALLTKVEHLLPPGLISPDQRPRIKQVAGALPVFAIDFFGFECRLGAAAGAVDCAANLSPDGAQMLAGRHPIKPPPELCGGAWDTLSRFYRSWGDTRTPAYVDGPATWLEFDTSDLLDHPNLLFGYWPETPTIRRPFSWLADEIIPMMLGRPMSAAFRANLQRCIENAPSSVNDFQIGLMFSRRVPAARLCVFDLPSDDLFGYLDRIGWTGDRQRFGSQLEALAPHADFVGLHLDIGEVVFPNIGIEPNFFAGCWTRQPHREPRWHGQFDALAAAGLITEEQRTALLGWGGYERLGAGGSEVLLLRGLSHLKVVLRPGQPTVAKAYFGIAQRPLEMGDGDRHAA